MSTRLPSGPPCSRMVCGLSVSVGARTGGSGLFGRARDASCSLVAQAQPFVWFVCMCRHAPSVSWTAMCMRRGRICAAWCRRAAREVYMKACLQQVGGARYAVRLRLGCVRLCIGLAADAVCRRSLLGPLLVDDVCCLEATGGWGDVCLHIAWISFQYVRLAASALFLSVWRTAMHQPCGSAWVCSLRCQQAAITACLMHA